MNRTRHPNAPRSIPSAQAPASEGRSSLTPRKRFLAIQHADRMAELDALRAEWKATRPLRFAADVFGLAMFIAALAAALAVLT